MVYVKEFEPKEIETKVEGIERELLVIKLFLRTQKKKKVALKNLISRINSNLVKDFDTTQFIRESRDRDYV